MNKKNIEFWDKTWREKDICILSDYLNEANLFSRNQIVWKLSLEYWNGVFKSAKGKNVLECGSGSGMVSMYLAKKDYCTHLLDISEPGVMLAKKNYEINSIKGHFIRGNVINLPFRDNVFDIVMSFGLLEYLTDIWTAIKEMVRTLKQGGIFAADISTNRFSIMILPRLFRNIIKFNFKEILQGNWRGPYTEVNSYSKKEYKNAMEEAGLSNIVITGTRPFPPAYPPLHIPFIIDRYIYSKFVKALRSFHRKFDHSNSRITDIWGCGWFAHGVKR
ncbi:MAG: class I SAM-dependent methyltransferase [bacterium]